MDQLLQQALGYLRGMWHRRWIGVAAAWLAAIIGVAMVYRIPEKYEASARVYVDTESLLRPLLSGLAIQPNLDQQVALLSRTLISRPNVEKLVRIPALGWHLAGSINLIAYQPPEGIQVGGARETTSHADDRDRLGRRPL